MTKRASWLLLLLALTGCGSHAEDSNDLESRLSTDTGVHWVVNRDDANRPMYLAAQDEPAAAPANLSREQAALAFLQRYSNDIGGGTDLASELTLLEDRDGPFSSGVHSLRFTQHIPNTDIRVFSSDTFVHFDGSGAIRFVAVGLVDGLASLSSVPANSPDDALAIGKSTITARDANADITSVAPPELVVYRTDDGKGTLAWRTRFQAFVLGDLEAPELFIDAQSGAVIESHDSAAHSMRTAKAQNVYDYSLDCLNDPKAKDVVSDVTYDDAFTAPPYPTTNRLYRPGDATQSTLDLQVFLTHTPGTDNAVTTPVVAADPTHFDDLGSLQGSGAAVSSFDNLAKVDAYFRNTLKQSGWDGTGTIPIRLAVHATAVVAKGSGYAWKDLDMFINDSILLGDGSPDDPTKTPTCAYRPSGVALDIVGHEFTHGVIAHAAQWGYSGEAGALNEGVADALGACVEHAYPLSSDDAMDDSRNFLMGEYEFLAQQGIRNLHSPRGRNGEVSMGELVPRAYSERLDMVDNGQNDNGHVHDNGVIVGHAFYLMTKGGTNEKTGLSVDPAKALGWSRAPILWYSTIVASQLRFGKTFHDFALGQSYLAQLYALVGDDQLTPAVCAWRAVEVLTDADVNSFKVTCTPASAPTKSSSSNTCSGHGGDVVLCDDAVPFSAVVCKNGGIVGNVTCADQTEHCKHVSDSDLTGSLDGDGALVCE